MFWICVGVFVYIIVGLSVANTMIEHTDYDSGTTPKEVRIWAIIKILFSMLVWPLMLSFVIALGVLGMFVGILVQIRGTLHEIYKNIERTGKNELR